jgi:hypothetical protein
MKKLLVLAILASATVTTGCNWGGNGRTGGGWFNWFNRGDQCRACGSGQIIGEDVYPGTLGAPILNNIPAAPRSMGELPGPVGITPVN